MPDIIDTAVPDVEVTDSSIESTELPEAPESVDTPISDPNTDEQSTDQITIPEESDGDGRTMPPKFKQYLKELQQTDPQLAKRLRGDFFALQQIRATYPGGMRDIQKVAALADQVGGAEGLAQFQSKVQELEEIDRQYDAAEPAFIDRMVEQNPEAFGKLIPLAITKYAQQDPDGYSHLMAGVVVNTVRDIANEMYAALSRTDEGKPLADKLAKWFNGMDDLARTKPVAKVDPEREKLTKERSEWEAQKAQDFHNSVTAEMRTFNTRQIDSDLMAQLTKAGKNPQQFQKQNADSYEILKRNCNEAIQQILQKDTAFINQHKALLQTGNKAKILQFTQAKIKLVSPEAVKRTLRAFLAFGGQRPTPTPKPGDNGNDQLPQREVQLSQEPKPNEIDWSRTNKGMILSGKAFLKNRKEMVRF